jgi:predicted anti-sigma-YlaC factor YlaD
MTSDHSVSPIDCHTTVRRLWDYLDEELDATRLAEVDAHLRQCTECREHFAFAGQFLRAVHESWPAVHEPQAVRDRVRATLEAEGFRVA